MSHNRFLLFPAKACAGACYIYDMTPSQAVTRSIFWLITPSLLIACLFLDLAKAAEPERVTIQTLLSPQATSYQQHLVTLEGMISELQIVPPSVGSYSLRSNPCLLYGRASFVVEDETGSLPVVVLGSCYPGAADALPRDGNRALVTGLVQVLKSEAPRDVRVQATQIQILESH